MNNSKKPNPWPTLPTDEDAAKFVEESDLSQYDWGNMVPITMEFRKKNSQLNLRLPEDELTRARAAAEREGMPLSRFVRLMIARGMQTLQSQK